MTKGLPQAMATSPQAITISVDRAAPPIGTSRLRMGTTHMEKSLQGEGNADAIARGKALLREGVSYSNQHIMGFGALNPWPDPTITDPARWNWDSLDRRIALAEQLGLEPVITLGMGPTWMVDPNWTSGTDWTQIERAILPQHEAAFARLCGEVAKRYPQVTYFQVWNEMKGLWLMPPVNNWDFQRYTRLYNLIWDKVKAANPAARLGGPYLIIEASGSRQFSGVSQTAYYTANPITPRNWAVIDYWLANRRYADGDFICIDRAAFTQDPTVYTPEQIIALSYWPGDIVKQIKARNGYRGEQIWFAELYAKHDPNLHIAAARFASFYYHALKAGTDVILTWSPEAQPGWTDTKYSLFTSTLVAGGGQPTPHYEVVKVYHDHFPPGTPLYPVMVSPTDPTVLALASDAVTLIINTKATPIEVKLDEWMMTLGAYDVTVTAAPEQEEPPPPPPPSPPPSDLTARVNALELLTVAMDQRLDRTDATNSTQDARHKNAEEAIADLYARLGKVEKALDAMAAAWGLP